MGVVMCLRVFAGDQRDTTEMRFERDDDRQWLIVVVAAGHFVVPVLELLVPLWIRADGAANQNSSNVVGCKPAIPGPVSCVLSPADAVAKLQKPLDRRMRFGRGQRFRGGSSGAPHSTAA